MTIALIALALLAGSPAPARATEGPVRIGQTALVGGPKVTPLAVLEDSRCPSKVVCVWAGRVTARVRVTGGAWSRTMNLTLGQPQPVADGIITLTRVTPARPRRGEVKSRDYRFTFVFQGGL